MAVGDSTKAKAVAAVSQARAEVKELEFHLSGAQSKLRLATTSDTVVDTITSPELIHENTEFLRRRTEATLADAQARVDRTEAELVTARNRLKWAERALNAIDGVQQTISDLVDDDSGGETGSPSKGRA